MRFVWLSGRWKQAAALVAAIAIAALLAIWYLSSRVAPVPNRPLRIGYEDNPPIQMRSAGGFTGLGVDTVNEAAKRAGIQLQWVETGTSSEEAFRKGLVDMWPLMVDLPERRKYIHFARPWIHSTNVLILREETPMPDRGFRGRIAVFKLPLHRIQTRQAFPDAQIAITETIDDVVRQVCTGQAAAGFSEARVAQSELREKFPECVSAVLRVRTIPGLEFKAGLASTFDAAGAADRIQQEISNMFQDGSLAVLIARYSYFGLDDTWASYERLEAEKLWRWLSWVGVFLVLAAGVTLWLATSLRQRKRAEAALRESEGRFRTLADNAPVMIVASGADGRATFFNRTWLDFTGRTMEQELGFGWIDSVHSDDRDRTLAGYSASLAARGECKLEYRLRRADGEYRYLMCTGVPRSEPTGAFAGFIASCIDLTDIKTAEQEARERQNLESLGVLAGGIAHDFNNLLGGTLAYSELAQVRLAEGASPDDELRQISAMAIRGSEIVRQLMIFAGNEGGALEPVDVSSLVTEMLDLLKVSISKHAVLKTSLGSGLPAVFGNPAQIRQVVMNLVTNASEAIGDRDGVIRVCSERVSLGAESNLPEGDYLRLEVADTGCGMSPEMQRKVFDPFFTTKFAGRGMGLAVVQQIVRRHGGSIQVMSSAGNGATIQILLPCTAEPARTADGHGDARSQSREPELPPGNTILVVEDEASLRVAVSRMLQRKGFSVIQAADGDQAFELIRSGDGPIDAMLLDITLPGVSSREVFQEARRHRPDLVVVLTSAYSRESVMASFAGLPVEHFIRKPFRMDDLVGLFRNTLSARSSSLT